ncbi:outer membrane lipoprotein chaperone LolA [Pseudoalteromonas sp. SR44-5]|jgi:outer membrane lipoprotein carrier protein|uniref:Outer-membrane lipoprotein carrier protein n=1 Tax=Pseudoalteromonas rhizosphaerae TaxID=2518973 RepID=A0ABW8L0X0_9GAMM|nr:MULTISPECIES: outer membrane lipoprotein chaperone LolA [Pseudoalteromonas]MBB1294433.1 outer membrane lipoprotein chaperone LolA [Pseudoalteromonas sp. SR41-4]MBB1335298.1 outer membrane lipoprotein chaperone LolA [Pseudoalteromonas sp. SR41-6]MBB1343929.1 outer membrane lipoprotein chaperone LolA [Pseudoalteromonas sp. SR45-6]MBB1368609.1 outer membrane lipoprotein chaperone LolA [Pseudoalteromonas sp. SR44-5]MBB1396714.1 outer membrane lipoprotein chaperone LolA [Pseudoalteromonas sp. SG|tara:strand:- start:331 stop:972 length:642 start_codon:yes stop_codon:yes gene_type:complete
MKQIKYLALAISCFLSASVFASDSATDDSQALQDKLAGLKSFQAQFAQQVNDDQGQSIMQGEGTIALQQPMMIRWQQASPDDTLFVSNGDKTYYFDSFAEQVTIMNTHSLIDSTPFVLLTSKDPAQWQKYQVHATDTGFSVTPNKGVESQVEQLDIVFAADKVGLASLLVKDSSGQSSTFTFSDTKVNQSLATSTFEFSIPEGVEIDDQSQGE